MASLRQAIETDPQTVPSERWRPEFGPLGEQRERDEVERDDAQAPLFAISD